DGRAAGDGGDGDGGERGAHAGDQRGGGWRDAVPVDGGGDAAGGGVHVHDHGGRGGGVRADGGDEHGVRDGGDGVHDDDHAGVERHLRDQRAGGELGRREAADDTGLAAGRPGDIKHHRDEHGHGDADVPHGVRHDLAG